MMNLQLVLQLLLTAVGGDVAAETNDDIVRRRHSYSRHFRGAAAAATIDVPIRDRRRTNENNVDVDVDVAWVRHLQDPTTVNDVHRQHDHIHGTDNLVGGSISHTTPATTAEAEAEAETAWFFEGDMLVSYTDIAVNYGVDVATKLAEDGFAFTATSPNNSSIGGITDQPYFDANNGNVTSSVDAAAQFNSNNDTSSVDEETRVRKLGLSNEYNVRTWNIRTLRNLTSGRVHIPYAMEPSVHPQSEVHATILDALATIEQSSGVVTFVPRTTMTSDVVGDYIYFRYLANACAATLGRGSPSYVYLGGCAAGHRGEIIHEVLHTLGFWHEQSRPDRDTYITVLSGNIISGAEINFEKQRTIHSLGSPYDYGSIMHYPSNAFSYSPDSVNTIEPTRTLYKWEVMGQTSQLSPSDIQQLRLLYQCFSGPRNLVSLTVDNLCSVDCKCWTYAHGSCDSDDECMGDLVCGPTPNPLPKGEEYRDQLPFSDDLGLISTEEEHCATYCHVSCCHLSLSRVLCPETCDTAPPPPEIEMGPLPRRMCLPPPTAGEGGDGGSDLTAIPTTARTGVPTSTIPTSARPMPSPTQRPTTVPTGGRGGGITPTTQWFIDWSRNGGMCVADCVGLQPCGGRSRYPWEAGYTSVEVCCGTMSWKPFKECSFATATISTTTTTTGATAPSSTTTTTTTSITTIRTAGTTTTSTSSTSLATTSTSTTTTGATTSTSSTTTTTSTTPVPVDTRWYPDETGATKCKNDGRSPSWLHHKYTTQSTCCTSHFSWGYNTCMGTKPTSSNKWYIDWSTGKCKQDCDKTSGTSCGGLVPGSWILLHASSDVCCRAHVSYAVELCKTLG